MLIKTIPYIHYNDLPSKSTNTETFFKEWIDYIFQNYESIFDEYNVIVAPVQPNNRGWCIGFTAQLYGNRFHLIL